MRTDGLRWIAFAFVAALIFLQVVFLVAPSDQRAAIWAIVYLFSFSLIWYLPHQFRAWNVPVTYLPVTYFFAGTILIVLGCLASAHLSRLHFKAEQWQSIAESIPLLLGAVVGGTYCGNAILGQEFDGKRCRVGPIGTLSGAILLLLVLMTLRTGPLQFDLWLAMLVATLSPSLALVFIGLPIEERPTADRAFRVFMTGVFLIFVAAVTALWLFAKVTYPDLNTTFLEKRDVVSMLKNLVPSYCGSIGAGLIARGMETNVPRFSLMSWVEENFGGFEAIKATGNKVELELKSPYIGRVIEMTLEKSDVDAMTLSSETRREYGRVLRDWLNTELYTASPRGAPRVTFDAPRVETLIKMRKTH
ncbi:hypothetical protein [Massilia sp.]|uniref:hypothetical protein n=1 Tax=Massilia sp. TaxID=1882437 RepID=UPI00391CDF75